MKRKRRLKLKIYALDIQVIDLNKLDEFTIYINYTRDLKYEQDPDYEYLRNLFRTVMADNKLDNDNRFDWIKVNEKNYNYSSNTTLHHNNIVLNNLQNNNQV